jgi:hypothetical protein
VAGIKVWARDQTLFSQAGELMSAEGIAAGCTSMNDLRERFRRGELTDPERTLRDTATAAWPWVRTDGDGAFTVVGLEDRPYCLRVMDDASALMVDTEAIAAGTADVVIRMPPDALFEVVRGQVVARSGDPIAGVSVRVQVDTQSLGRTNMHGRAQATATTDAEGRFELRDVPKEHAYLRLDGEGIVPLEYGRRVPGGLLQLTGGNVRTLRLEVRVRLHVQVELADPATADALQVLDSGGDVVTIDVFSGRGRRSTDDLAFADGKTPVFVVPDNASTLILLKGGKEIARHAPQLRAGAVNTLRY